MRQMPLKSHLRKSASKLLLVVYEDYLGQCLKGEEDYNFTHALYDQAKELNVGDDPLSTAFAALSGAHKDLCRDKRILVWDYLHMPETDVKLVFLNAIDISEGE